MKLVTASPAQFRIVAGYFGLRLGGGLKLEVVAESPAKS
jgi:hypothetical protein